MKEQCEVFTGHRFFALFLRRQIKILGHGTADLVISPSSSRVSNYMGKFDPTIYTDIGIFRCYNPSDRTMTLGLTQPLTEMSARNVSWRVKKPSA